MTTKIIKDYTKQLLSFLDEEVGMETANTVTLVDQPDGAKEEYHLEPNYESVEGKDLVGGVVEVKGKVPEGGRAFKAKQVIDIRKQKDAPELKWDAKRKCYVKIKKV